MFVVRLNSARPEDLSRVEARVAQHGTLIRSVSLGQDWFVLFRSDDLTSDPGEWLCALPGVAGVQSIETPYVLSSRLSVKDRTCIRLEEGVVLGGDEFVVMAGPCTVETETQVATIAKSVAASGARVLRGGAFKPRTSPFSFQCL